MKQPITKALEFISNIHGATAICFDNSNILRSGMQNGWRIDFDLCRQYFCGEKLISATIAVTHAPFDRPCQRGFYNWLKRIGWVVNTFAPLVSESGVVSENECEVDGDVCVQIRDAVQSGAFSIVVFSGDHSMVDAVWEARRAGVQVYVVAGFGCLSKTLANAAGSYAYIEDLLPLIGRAYH